MSCNQNTPVESIGRLHAESESFYDIVPEDAILEKMGVDFQFTEGPVWHDKGYLLFSDIPANRIYKMDGRNIEVFREPSGNSNGLRVDREGAVIACEHGTRSVARYAQDGSKETIADNYKGARLNSPNDLCIASSGIIYFTDPPYGLKERNNDPAKEIPFSGVYMIRDGSVLLVDSTLSWPNGIALSPDEDYLYVANFEREGGSGEMGRQVFWVRYSLDERGNVTGRTTFFEAPDTDLPGGPDGMKVDKKGNLFVTGPGGILVINEAGTYLGRIELPVPATNLAFGQNEKELYITARSMVMKINLK